MAKKTKEVKIKAEDAFIEWAKKYCKKGELLNVHATDRMFLVIKKSK